jgi:hypothetical protein
MLLWPIKLILQDACTRLGEVICAKSRHLLEVKNVSKTVHCMFRLGKVTLSVSYDRRLILYGEALIVIVSSVRGRSWECWMKVDHFETYATTSRPEQQEVRLWLNASPHWHDEIYRVRKLFYRLFLTVSRRLYQRVAHQQEHKFIDAFSGLFRLFTDQTSLEKLESSICDTGRL